MADDLKSALLEFVRFAQTLRGDEKSEAQSFLDQFFRALGHKEHDRSRSDVRVQSREETGLAAARIVFGDHRDEELKNEVVGPTIVRPISRNTVAIWSAARRVTSTQLLPKIGKRDQFEARKFTAAFGHVEERVMPDVLQHAEREKAATGKQSTRWTRLAQRWWQLRDQQPGTIAAINSVPRYIACSRVTRWPIFEFVSSAIHPDNTLVVFPFADDYSFGVLQSSLHTEWFGARCSTLGTGFRYTSDTVFDTFPWPQNPTKEQIKAVADAGVALRSLRRETMRKLNYSLRDLYRTLDQPGDNPLRDAHVRLDATVRAAYGMADDADPLAFLLDLNLACAVKEKAGEKITPPGLPLPQEEDAALVTNDCIEPPKI